MRIQSIQAVDVLLPPAKPRTQPRRESWRQLSPIGLPMSFYPEFPPTVP